MKNLTIPTFAYFAAISFILSLMLVTVAFAQPGTTQTQSEEGTTQTLSGEGTVRAGEAVSVQNPLSSNTIAELFEAIIDIIMVFAIPIIVFFIVYAGFLYVTARGNQETIQKAHRALLYAIIGGLLILGANVLISVIGGTVDAIKN